MSSSDRESTSNSPRILKALLALGEGSPDQLTERKQRARDAVERLSADRVDVRLLRTDRTTPDVALELAADIRIGDLDIIALADGARLPSTGAGPALIDLASELGVVVLLIEGGLVGEYSSPLGGARYTSGGKRRSAYRASVRMRAASEADLSKRGDTDRPPFGYVIDSAASGYCSWRPDPATTPVIVDIYSRLEQGFSCSDVAAELNERSGGAVFSASTRPWNSFSVARLAKHPLYTGMINRGFRGLARLLNGKSAILRRPGRVGWLSYPHLAHVDRFLWERANARLR